jgi:hypothetical protein
VRIDGHGEVRVLERRTYDHSRGVYYAVVLLNDGREVVVTSRNHAGPYQVTLPWTIHPQPRVG